MKTVYGKLTGMIVLILAALLLLIPMRSGQEDHLYAYPRNLRMNRGDSYGITYTLDADRYQKVSYTSVDASVATVDSDGLITAVSPGSTDIHLDAAGGARTTVHVEVVGTPATRLTLNTDSVTMEKGQVTGLRAAFNDGADDTRIEWHSRDDAIASVDEIGRVTAVSGGRTQVYAVAPSGLSAAADIYVHVSGDVMRITPEELTVGTGARLRMGAAYLPEDATEVITRWTTSDPSILDVDGDGMIRAVGVGQAVLSAFTREGLTTSAVIRVEQSAERFDISPTAVTIDRGATLELEPRFLNESGEVDTRASKHYIVWNSSNPDVATVHEGRVAAKNTGTTRITASADGMTAACDLRVQVLVRRVTLDQHEVYLLRQDTVEPIQLHTTIVPADPDDPTITYETNNDMVAYVDETGLVKMTGGYGTAIITARASSGAEDHFTVNVVTQLPEEEAEPAGEGTEEAPADEEEESGNPFEG